MFRQLSVSLISSFIALSLLAAPAMSLPEKQDAASQDADSKSYLPPAMRQPGKGDGMSAMQDDKNRVKAAPGHAKKKFKTRYASSRTRRYYARNNDVFFGGGGFLGIFGF